MFCIKSFVLLNNKKVRDLNILLQAIVKDILNYINSDKEKQLTEEDKNAFNLIVENLRLFSQKLIYNERPDENEKEYVKSIISIIVSRLYADYDANTEISALKILNRGLIALG